jgi:hypothetical protein
MQPDFSRLCQADLSKSHTRETPPAKLMMKIAHGVVERKQAILIERANGTQKSAES